MGLRAASLLLLWLALSSANEIKKGRTRSHGHYVCSTWGNNHFKTFDGDIYQFPGFCEYNFVSDCREAYKEFSVHIQRALNSNGHPEIQYILVKIKDIMVYLKPNLVVVDGRIVKTPYYTSGVLIESNEIYTKIYAKLGLVLMWNQQDALMVELDNKFNNHTCGLCGDYNGIQIYNEFIKGDASYNSITYGNMQKISKPNAKCEDPDETQALPSCNEHRDECQRLLTSPAFADCRLRLNLEMYIQACMQDKCACNGKDDSFCLCSTISEYSRQCSHAGGRPGEWRTQNFCPKTCPATMVYRESSSPCMDTCSHLQISSLCEEHYMDGCFCPEGTVYDDISEKGCIPVSQCHCKHGGKAYAPGESISKECEECTCNSGRWTCKDLPCPGTCSVQGGSHFTTFDGKKYTFHGDCYYVLAKGTANESYALLAELAPCGSTDKQTCLKTVVLLVDNKKNVVVFRSDGSVLLNEMTVNVPHVSSSFSVFKPSSNYFIVQTPFGLQMQIQLFRVMQLFVTVDQSVKGKIQGLCGNFNGMEGDDFRTTSGLIEATGSAFANTWKAQSTCTDQVEKLEDPCSLSIESANYAEHWCSLLKNPKGPFARCHSAVDPSEYYKKCKYDTCLCEDNEECLCAALSSYSRACAFKGVILGGWRKSVCSNEASSCPGNQVFLYNLTMCQQTCRSLADGEKYCLQDFAPVDGCGCPPNTYLDNQDNCVPISQCPCYYKGSYLESGEYFTKDGERCVCRNAKIQCTSVKIRMKSEKECSSSKTYFDCNASSKWTSQTPLQLSCHTPQTDHFQTECVSGCVCPEGLYDDGRGGCVEQNNCPCIHNNEWYSSGDKIKVDCNTCTCQKGVWKCTDDICYGTCMIYGSGHYNTFDGKFYDFDGSCEYVATQDFCGDKNSSGSFSIITENVPCGTTGVTCSKAIKMFLGKTELKLENKEYKEIQRDVGDDVQYWNRTVGLYLVIEASNGVMLIWDKKTTVFIKLSPDYKGKVCGLCGNFDDKANNDFTTRSGLLDSNPLNFGNSWKQSPMCPDVTQEIKPCDLKPHRKSWAEKECSIIQSEVFKICHSKVDPLPYYEACVHDACSCDTGGDCECFCSAVAAYAQECIKAEACVFWRTPDICPIFCDYYNPRNECDWHYEPCGSNITTCRMINNVTTNFTIPLLEGCYPRCPNDKPIYNEETKQCVTEDQCGCYLEDGTHVPLWQEVPSENCTICVCVPSGSIECKPVAGCPCVINGTSYEVDATVGVVQDGDTCIRYVCAENGSVVPAEVYPCPASSPTTISTFSPYTTLTTTTTTASTTSRPVTTTPCIITELICDWTEWFDVSKPEEGGGDYETYDEIRKHGHKICTAPEEIECRAKDKPDLTLEQLGQKVECNVKYGLICKNDEQDITMWPLCYNYEIRVNCCEWQQIPCEPTITPTIPQTSTTTQTTITSSTTTRTSTEITTTPIHIHSTTSPPTPSTPKSTTMTLPTETPTTTSTPTTTTTGPPTPTSTTSSTSSPTPTYTTTTTTPGTPSTASSTSELTRTTTPTPSTPISIITTSPSETTTTSTSPPSTTATTTTTVTGSPTTISTPGSTPPSTPSTTSSTSESPTSHLPSETPTTTASTTMPPSSTTSISTPSTTTVTESSTPTSTTPSTSTPTPTYTTTTTSGTTTPTPSTTKSTTTTLPPETTTSTTSPPSTTTTVPESTTTISTPQTPPTSTPGTPTTPTPTASETPNITSSTTMPPSSTTSISTPRTTTTTVTGSSTTFSTTSSTSTPISRYTTTVPTPGTTTPTPSTSSTTPELPTTSPETPSTTTTTSSSSSPRTTTTPTGSPTPTSTTSSTSSPTPTYTITLSTPGTTTPTPSTTKSTTTTPPPETTTSTTSPPSTTTTVPESTTTISTPQSTTPSTPNTPILTSTTSLPETTTTTSTPMSTTTVTGPPTSTPTTSSTSSPTPTYTTTTPTPGTSPSTLSTPILTTTTSLPETTTSTTSPPSTATTVPTTGTVPINTRNPTMPPTEAIKTSEPETTPNTLVTPSTTTLQTTRTTEISTVSTASTTSQQSTSPVSTSPVTTTTSEVIGTESTTKTTTSGPTPSRSSSTTPVTETPIHETTTTRTTSPPIGLPTTSTPGTITTSGPSSPTGTQPVSTTPFIGTESTTKTTTSGPTPSRSSSTTPVTETPIHETTTTRTTSPPIGLPTTSTPGTITTSGPSSPTGTQPVSTTPFIGTESTTKTTTSGPTPSVSTPPTTTVGTERSTPTTTSATVTTPTTSPTSTSPVSTTTSGTTPTQSFTTTSGTTSSSFITINATTTMSTTFKTFPVSTTTSGPTTTSTSVTTTGSSTHSSTPPVNVSSSTTALTPTTAKKTCSIFPNETHEEGDSWILCNCTKVICIEDNIFHVIPIICNPPPKPTCANGLSPVPVMDEDGCCWHWECDCYCTGWGDPHYMTFDGLYYSYQGNCTYVLVEEINKKVDNFGVYIDNYHCDTRDVVSCPRTLIVRHETQEVRLTTAQPNTLQVEVTVNNQLVALPYKKFGVSVYESGINRVVEIPELKMNVTYNGLSFSIRMPYSLFGNNTQGQCGTCNNNTADDCMLPNGNIAENCETMADHWQVVDPSKPQCSPGLVPTGSPSTTPAQPCKESSICELLLGSVFKPCHAFVQPEKYYAACVFDSCVLPNLDLECSSLQIYAATCADQGACIDWRKHTNGVCCTYECPSGKEYRACGPIKQMTCKSRGQNETSTKQAEGCFCPNGTMLYDSGVDVCVKTCGCVGVDMIPREFGEKFTVDCQDCICLEGEHGIVCEPHVCDQKKVTCDGEGFYEVIEVNPKDSCCPLFTCKCNTSLCTSKAPKCSLGFEVHSYIPSGQCCPAYQCVPKGVCVHENAEFLPNSSVFVDKCQNCVCTNDVNVSTQLNIISCEHVPCNTKCQPGYELKPVKGECCGKCVQTKCIIHTVENSELILSPGDFKNDPHNNCTIYSCVEIHDQLVASTSEITCPAFNEESCKPGTISFLPNGCCRTCAPLDSRTPCSVRHRSDFIVYNGCRSVDRVDMTECEGTCGTFSLYSAEANSMDHSCSCCRETSTTEKHVVLKCPGGHSVSHKYIYVDSCSCQDTECQPTVQ
uniref:mucin-2 n=1 Tax=Lonchura striata TaxID=40157 RepID=UPI000B4C2570|nr:mucin-2 [Lonchura striata domestica]